MNKIIVFAAALSMATFFLHVIGGGAEVHAPMLESDLSLKLKAFASILWHFVSVVLFINSFVLYFAARHPAICGPLVLVVTAQYLSASGLFLFYGAARLGTLWVMPQWIIFSVMVAICLLGLRLDRRVFPA